MKKALTQIFIFLTLCTVCYLAFCFVPGMHGHTHTIAETLTPMPPSGNGNDGREEDTVASQKKPRRSFSCDKPSDHTIKTPRRIPYRRSPGCFCLMSIGHCVFSSTALIVFSMAAVVVFSFPSTADTMSVLPAADWVPGRSNIPPQP